MAQMAEPREDAKGPSAARAAAAAAALACGGGLALQLYLEIPERGGLGPALWRMAGFYTILTNLGCTVIALAMALAPRGRLAAPGARLSGAVSILLVGLVYTAALRHLHDPQGLDALSNHLLHDIGPPLFGLAWALAPHGALRARHALLALAPPLAFCVYALIRGGITGWYPYWFIRPAEIGWDGVLLAILALLAAFAGFAFLLLGADRLFARRTGG